MNTPLRKFRFEDLELWKLAIDAVNKLFDLAIILYRFAEQCRGSGMNLSTNIAEGSGSYFKIEFRQFLKYSRRSFIVYANMINVLLLRKLIEEQIKEQLFEGINTLSRKITTFQKTLNA